MLSLHDRRELRGLPLLDLGLAAGLLVASLGAILTGEVDEGPRAVTIPVAVVTCLAVALRTRATLPATVVLCAATGAQELLGDRGPATLMSLLITLVICYSLAAENDEGPAAVGLTLLLLTNFFVQWHQHGSDYAFDTMVLGGIWLLGRAARSLRSRASYAEQHQQDLAALAVAQERARIARELHDVVAHALSVIAVQADAAEAAIHRDPARAVEPMRAIRDSARRALSDMRALLHVLRAEGTDSTEEHERRPTRGVGDLDELVEGMRDAGLPVRVSIRVRPDLPPGTGLAVYRIAQEALTNVLKHAGPAASVLDIEDDGRMVRIVVRNTAGSAPHHGSPGSGHGLLGVRERVLAAGGTVRAGPTPEGGFELTATLRVDGSDAPAAVDGATQP